MKIKRYKLFESATFEDLADELSQDIIDEYYDENYSIDIEEIIENFTSLIWNNIDDDRFVEDYISDEIDSRDFDDFSEYDYKEWIENVPSDVKKQKILEIYKDKNSIEDDVVSELDGIVSIIEKDGDHTAIVKSKGRKIKRYELPSEHTLNVDDGDIVKVGSIISMLEYDDNMVDDLDEDELKDIIREDNEEDDFIESVVKGWHENESAQDLIENIYGNNMRGSDLYRIVRNYIDEDEIEKDYKDNEDFDYKKEYVSNRISDDSDLQRKIIEDSDDNILKLAEALNDNGDIGIMDEYDNQKLYVEKYKEEHDGEGPEDRIIAQAIYNLYDWFGLDSDIEEEYVDYMQLVNMKKYNI
jgi:hypothetical protein